MADWAQQVQSLSRELGVWKNECSNKHELWIRATELLQVTTDITASCMRLISCAWEGNAAVSSDWVEP